VALAIKRYKAWGEHSVNELDDLIDIVRRKIAIASAHLK
jgi:hypothetical protein